MTGQTISHYKITEKLGEGGMGEVYLAEDTSLKRKVALKFLPDYLQQDEIAQKRFLREAQSAAALDHPFICKIFEVGEADGKHFIVMEYVKGQTLKEKLREGPAPLKQTLQTGMEIAEALEEAHKAGIAHRDLKPANIMLTSGGHVKVMDFGLAKKVVDEDGTEQDITSALTREGTTLGTLAYMSPEQLRGKTVDTRTDIFSFGIVLYELLSGVHPFRKPKQVETTNAILSKDPSPLSRYTEDTADLLQHTVEKMLAKDADDRYQTVHEIRTNLKKLSEKFSVVELVVEPVRKKSNLWLGVMALLALVAVASIVFWLKSPPLPEPLPPVKMTPLTSTLGREYAPTFSPDGNQIAFVHDGDIFVKQIGVEEPEVFVQTPAWDGSPVWSPDGNLIAFRRVDWGAEKVSIIVKPQRGGTEQTLAEFELSEGANPPNVDHRWSSDGRHLIAVGKLGREEKFGLVTLSVETREITRLTSPGDASVDGCPAISPDDRLLVFTRFFPGNRSNLFLGHLDDDLNLEGSPTQLTSDNLNNYGAIWTTDGKEIIFVKGYEYGDTSLWRMDPFDPEDARRLHFAAEGANHPAISRDGKRLAFALHTRRVDIWQIPIGGNITDSARPERLISSTRRDLVPDLSPDGRLVAFSSNRSSDYEIWVCGRDGSRAHVVTSLAGYSMSPRWSPDSQDIAFSSTAEGNLEIYVVSLSGGTPRRLTHSPSRDDQPSWSHDGRWVYFRSERSGSEQVWRILAEGGDPEQITSEGGSAPIDTPDGESVFYLKDNRLWTTSAQGDNERQMSDFLLADGRLAKTIEGVYCRFWSEHPQGLSLGFLRFGTGEFESLDSRIPDAGYGFAVSPEGGWILYSLESQESSDSDLILVENFR